MTTLAHLFNRARFGAWLARFAPFWLVWALVFLFPPTREVGRLVFRGSNIDRNLSPMSEFWGPSSYSDSFDPTDLAEKEPNNPDLAWWTFGHNLRSSYDYLQRPYSDNQFAHFWPTVARFKNENWLRAAPFRYAMNSHDQQQAHPFKKSLVLGVENDFSKSQKLRRQVRLGAARDPKNAFWPLAQALLLMSTKQHSQVLPLIEKAAKCEFYSDGGLEAARHLVRAQSRFRSLSFEERARLLRHTDDYYGGSHWRAMDTLAAMVLRDAQRARKEGETQRALKLCGVILRLSNFLMSGDNSLQTAQTGARWQSWVRYLATPGLGSKRTAKFGAVPPNLATWNTYAKASGAPHLAILTTKLQMRAAEIARWETEIRRSGNGYEMFNLRFSAGRAGNAIVERAQMLRWLGVMVAFSLFLVGFFWLVVNVFMIRAKGVASTRAERVWPAGFMALTSALLGGAVFWWIMENSGARPPRSSAHEALWISLGLFAWLGPPFILGVWCAFSTMRRHRHQFFGTPRVDVEMRLSPTQRLFVRDYLPMLCLSAVGTLVFGWCLMMLAMTQNWGRIDILQLLPPDRNGKFGDLSLDFHMANEPVVLMYGLFVCGVFFLAWFLKWRFLASPEAQPILHSSLRRFKETLGAFLCFASVLFLLLAIFSVPARQKAEKQLEIYMARGELAAILAKKP